jgi:hypothetical protein
VERMPPQPAKPKYLGHGKAQEAPGQASPRGKKAGRGKEARPDVKNKPEALGTSVILPQSGGRSGRVNPRINFSGPGEKREAIKVQTDPRQHCRNVGRADDLPFRIFYSFKVAPSIVWRLLEPHFFDHCQKRCRWPRG